MSASKASSGGLGVVLGKNERISKCQIHRDDKEGEGLPMLLEMAV